eukprot:Lithocolla_globosa_v1_NODE_3401_length_1681_cov_48.214505.p2 type:complete len:145 gc:universal NODE_3401_length_1681_cov_48.214505:763-1197(+)
MTKSGFKAMIWSHMALMASSSICNTRVCLPAESNSPSNWDSAFLYSRLQSKRIIRGFSMRRRIDVWVTSLFNITPSKTRQSSISPPGIFSTLAYRLISISLRPASSFATQRTASRAIPHMRSLHRLTNLVPMQLLMTCKVCLRS